MENVLRDWEIELHGYNRAKEFEREFNNSKFYVTVTDELFSFHGRAQGKTNRLAICCKDYEEAKKVVKNLKKEPKMKYVYICSKIPKQKEGQLLQFMSKALTPIYFN